MSIEGIEAHILAIQINKETVGKTIFSYETHNSQQFQQKGFISKNIVLDQIIGCKILSVTSRATQF